MRILLVEDDAFIRARIRRELEARGNVVEEVGDGQEALTQAIRDRFDIAIVDLKIPRLDGLSVLRGMRAAGCTMPVIVLSALSSVEDRVAGLDSGADDYITKPFSLAELVARVNAVSRRPVIVPSCSVMRVADLELNVANREVRRDNQPIALLPKEFSILRVLMENEGRVLTRDMLLERVWNIDFDPQSTVVETHVSRLRSKVDKPFAARLIHTSRNCGYVLHAPR